MTGKKVLSVFLPLILSGLIIAGLFLFSPQSTAAAGLIPCDGGPGDPCQACQLVELADNVVDWLVVTLSVVAAIMIIYAGFVLVTSGGNTSAKEKAKSLITNLIVGFLIVLGGWLLVDTGMKMLVGGKLYGVWNKIECVYQPKSEPGKNIGIKGLSPTGYNATRMSEAEIATMVASITNNPAARNQAILAATKAGLSAEEIRQFLGIVQQESGMCTHPTMISEVGALGCAQLMPDTARGLDPSATRERLLTDNQYNMDLGAQYFKQMLNLYGGDIRLATAAYNGGPVANEASVDCPGLRKWECEWDDKDHTKPNEGYIQTRNYVANVTATAAKTMR